MFKTDLWKQLNQICHAILDKEELLLIKANFHLRICKELKEHQKNKQSNYLKLMKLSLEMENKMLEDNMLRNILLDILSTEEYDAKGIAYYTHTHEDIVQEVISGQNTRPSAIFFHKVLELHQSVRKEIYDMILKKILKSIEFQT